MTSKPDAVLVTGATGTIGGLLVPALLETGVRVHVLVREPARLTAAWASDVHVSVGSVEDRSSVARAASGCRVAYYLVHGMDGALATLAARERTAAAAFREGAAGAGVRRIVYLGGLVDEDRLAASSEHLYARQQAGVELRAGPVSVTELRAGIVLAPGSASVRLALAAARAPVQVWGPWATSRVQPIAADDLTRLLLAVADDPRAGGEILDVGGPDVLTYEELVGEVRTRLHRSAAPALRARYLPVEVAATMAAARAGLPRRLTLALLQSVAADTVVRDERARRWYAELLSTPVGAALDAVLADGA